MKDSYYHKGLRKKLVATIRAKGIEEEKVLQAIESIPRHFFLDNAFAELAYEDRALPIGKGQTISQPYTVAFQTELLGIQKGDKVLEIGTGSGYQACVLAALGAKVYTVERQESLYLKTQRLLEKMDVPHIRMYLDDGHLGLTQKAPFDKILVTAAAEKMPETLKEQLTIGGVLVVPVGMDTQQMYRLVRLSESDFYAQVYGDFQFVRFERGVKREK
ncbi:MAG: protein-L-isoaspartate(D-aspartate) O-methyltransferase [Bacteroidota bacterium]